MTDTDTPNLPREWDYKEFIARGMNGPDAAEDQQRARALANLRDKIRDAGHVIIPESLIRDEGTLITVTNPETADWCPWDGTGQPDGTMYRWTASATARGTDTGDLLPAGEDAAGRRWFIIPSEVGMTGGDVRLRHGFGVDPERVTLYAFDEAGQALGYTIAVGVDENVHSIELLPGVASVTAEIDPAPTADTDGRLLWMLRFLADEFGALGVLVTAREMWPDAFKVAATEPAPEHNDEPTPG